MTATEKASPEEHSTVVSASTITSAGLLLRIMSPVFTEGKPVSWTLYSVTGKKLRAGVGTTAHGRLEIPIALYPPGTYLLKTENGGMRRGFRFVKN
jgi:hypothetical protein